MGSGLYHLIVYYDRISKIETFRERYFLMKFKKKIISWLWKSRESKIHQQFHPKHLHNFLEHNNVLEDDGETLDKFLNQW